MTVGIELTRKEETALVGAVVAAYPAAKALNAVKLEDGQIRASVDSPLGKIDVILELRITGG